MPFKRSLYLLQPFCQREVHYQIDCYIIGIDNNFVRLCRDINQAFVDLDTQIALSRSFNHRDCSFLENLMKTNLLFRQVTLSHGKKVEDVQAQVREWIQNGSKVQMCTARPGLFLRFYFKLFFYAKMFVVRLDNFRKLSFCCGLRLTLVLFNKQI
jgi:hypothetical protein